MIVRVTQDAVTVDEANDFARLMILTCVGIGKTVGRLSDLGLVSDLAAADDERPVWLSIPTLRQMAQQSSDTPSPDDWLQSWSGMIAFAEKHGWVRDGAYVRAHVEEGC